MNTINIISFIMITSTIIFYVIVLYKTIIIQKKVIETQKNTIGVLESNYNSLKELINEQKKYISTIEKYNDLIPKEQIKELYNIDDILGEISLKGIDKVDKDKLDYLKNYGKDNKG